MCLTKKTCKKYSLISFQSKVRSLFLSLQNGQLCKMSRTFNQICYCYFTVNFIYANLKSMLLISGGEQTGNHVKLICFEHQGGEPISRSTLKRLKWPNIINYAYFKDINKKQLMIGSEKVVIMVIIIILWLLLLPSPLSGIRPLPSTWSPFATTFRHPFFANRPWSFSTGAFDVSLH